MVWKNTKLYVGNLPESVQAIELQEYFEKFGKVEECDIVKNYGFVHMSTEDEAKVAIENLNNTEFKGSKITVEASRSKVRPRPGMGGKGQCYRCGRQGHWSKECPRNPNARLWANPVPPPMPGPPPMGGGYPEQPLPRYGMERAYTPERSYMQDRSFAPDRGFGGDRTYASERMRPYPDPYERPSMPPPSPGPPGDDYYYYGKPYDDYTAHGMYSTQA